MKKKLEKAKEVIKTIYLSKEALTKKEKEMYKSLVDVTQSLDAALEKIDKLKEDLDEIY